MSPNLPVVLAEPNAWGIAFFITMLVLQYVAPLLRKRNQRRGEGDGDGEELSPDEQSELLRRLREAAEAGQDAAQRVLEAAPEQPAVAPRPGGAGPSPAEAAAERPRRQERVEEAADRLREGVLAWRSAAGPVIGRRAAERLTSIVRERLGDFEGSVAHWVEADVAAAQAATGVLVDAAMALDPLAKPGRRIMWRAVESLTERVLETAPASHETEELVLVPLASQLGAARTRSALEQAGLVPILLPVGGVSPARALGLMVVALREVIARDARDVLPVVGATLDRLARETGSGAGLAAALVDFTGRGDARQLLQAEIPTALALRHSGPLAALLFGPATLEELGAQPALVRRAAYASTLIDSRLTHSDPALAVWDAIVGALVNALEATGFGGEMAESLWVLVDPWGPAEDHQARAVAQWLRGGGTTAAPSRIVDPIVALVAWRLVGKLGRERLGYLADAVDGKHQPVVQVRPVVPSAYAARGGGSAAVSDTRATWQQALAMQVVLGPPRARLGPKRVPSLWGRRHS